MAYYASLGFSYFTVSASSEANVCHVYYHVFVKSSPVECKHVVVSWCSFSLHFPVFLLLWRLSSVASRFCVYKKETLKSSCTMSSILVILNFLLWIPFKFKGTVQPKTESFYSPSSFKPVWISFYFWTQKNIFSRMLVTKQYLFPYYESQ